MMRLDRNVFFILMSEPSLVNKRDLQALTLVGPTVKRPVPDPLAVLSINNQLCMLEVWLNLFSHQP